ncbi:hypothetical protein RHMOL_Rhmol13G0024100 [Rhododendron molle]|nr:hypothetical protein RHMOL_Rhmol13G0024100 [Rhododendron molle]
MASAWAQKPSSSSSPIPPQRRYDVFLSFSGIDTRNNFTSHLLAALERHGFHTFKDNTNLNRGEDIGYELLKAIEDSRISLVVLSRNYAASGWCLDELVKIMECWKTLQHIVFPIFHGVGPTDVRAQKGSLAEAFNKHAERFKDQSPGSKVEKWKEALTQIANLSGWDLPTLDNGRLKQVWKGTKILGKLKFLYLSHCYYLTRTPDFSGLNNLQELLLNDCIRNNLRTLPDSICNLTRLKKLYLSHCDVSHLPSEIGRLVTLEALILEGNNLVNLPGSICNLACLKNLNLSLCDVSHLPNEIGRLISLQKLNLGGNNLVTLPDSICNLACLEVLSLRQCNVSHLPDGIGMLSSLKWFDLTSNNVSILPNSFSDLASLEILTLSNCGRLQSLPKLPASLCHVDAINCTLLLERIPTEWTMPRMIETYLPGDEVPNWYPYQYTRSKLSLVVPPLVTRRIIGWSLCIVFRIHKKPGLRSCMHIFSKKTEGLRNENKYKTGVTYQDEDRMKLMYFPSIVTGIHLFGGDELEIEISPDDQEKTVPWLTVKKCGIRLIYEDDVDITETNVL